MSETTTPEFILNETKYEGHTKQPWTAGQVRENPIFDIIGTETDHRGARESIGSFHASQNKVANKANALLMADSPQLLAGWIAERAKTKTLTEENERLKLELSARKSKN